MNAEESRLRVIDANLNRAAEGLRVAEDVTRFHWNLPGLAGELKELRHRLLALGRQDPARSLALVSSRDVAGDVGRALGVAGPTGRLAPARGEANLAFVAESNLERAREALRVLEELSRDERPAEAAEFEAIRYRLYSLERAIVVLAHRAPARDALAGRRLYLLLTEGLATRPWREALLAAIEGGVDVVQLREKHLSDRALLDRAREVREITARSGVLFFVNDRPDIARLASADGVHLGANDLSLAEARAVAGDHLLIGISTHSLEDARLALDAGADLVGVGPCFPTATKDAGPPLAREERRRMLATADVPAFAIGGVTSERLPELLEDGVVRVAVASAILAAHDPEAAARRLIEGLEPKATDEA